jgi:hypothetical protein
METKIIDGRSFLILSVERTKGSRACVWWRANADGYTTSLGDAGLYNADQIRHHADPPHHVAIPVKEIEIPASALKRLLAKALPVSRFAQYTPAELRGPIGDTADGGAK